MKRLVNSVQREKWLAARRKGIGASDAAKVLGVSRWGGPLHVYADKVGPEQMDDDRDREDQYWGHVMERLILERGSKEIGVHLARDGWLYQNEDRPWQLATPDGHAKDERLNCLVPVEAKFVPMAERLWDDGLPGDVAAQAHHQMSVMNAPYALVVALIVPLRFVWVRLERDPEFEHEVLLPAEERFWKQVQERRPPDAEGCAETLEALRRLWPEDNGEIIELPQSAEVWANQLTAAREHMKLLKKDEDQAKAELFKVIGEAQAGRLPDGRIVTAKSHVKQEHVVKESTARPLRIKERKS